MEKRGVASIAILPSGSISGHFVDALTSQCFGLFGTQIACERECSRGEDYKLINLSILDFDLHHSCTMQVAILCLIKLLLSRWEEDVMAALQRKDQGVCVPSVKFECEILKADGDAECHIQKYLPSLVGRGAIVNVGTMNIKGLKFGETKGSEDMENEGQKVSNTEFEAEKHRGDDGCNRQENMLDKSGEVIDCGVPTSISVSGKGPYSGCLPSSKEFAEILQEELELEGLPKHGFKETILTGWREKRAVSQESEDSF